MYCKKSKNTQDIISNNIGLMKRYVRINPYLFKINIFMR